MATRIKLSPELISLVHHVELNKTGWFNKATERLILAAIWLSGQNLTIQSIIETLKNDFSVNLEYDETKSRIDSLCSSGILVKLPTEQFKISEKSKKRENFLDVRMIKW